MDEGVGLGCSRRGHRGGSGDRPAVRLEAKGLRVQQRLSSDSDDCFGHSYGQVQEYFRSHPCSALFRVLFEVSDRPGNMVLVAVAWVDMPDEAQASELRRLMDRDGTGNVTELSRESGKYRDVRFTGDFYRSTLDGVTVINAAAEPTSRAASAVDLAGRVVSAVTSEG
ncbi:hypothetical protein [Pseudonocardia sp. GCM10023141]|uniref:hypothetical protein n=1 Tax=Pseudonocardia sp. GCM10023141 TaxID=3252653 RepID=UPI00360EE9A7